MKKLFLSLSLFFLFQIVFAATIEPISNGKWNTAATWPDGQLPGALDDVVIPEGFLVFLEGTIKVKTITVNGTLRSLNQGDPIDLETEWIMVSGSSSLFRVGTAEAPYNVSGGCKITLTGPDDGDNIMGMGDKFIISMNGGRVQLFGEDRINWTHLGSNADIGNTQITMAEPVDWQVNDEIVIVSSRMDWNEAEKRKITAISNDGLLLTLDTALNFPHISALETYTRNTDNKTWNSDLRAEVGLLTHNVKVQGDAFSEVSGFGGHMMCMMNSQMIASGVELYRMGQKAKVARYPWHWHMLHDFGTGQYFKNSSVHHSFNRALTIHGTNYTTVDNNFFYEHIGHGVFLEDGSERFNTITNNVTLLSVRPQPGEEVTPSDNQFDDVQNRTPSSYLITNPNNIFENNVAAGTEGTGFWFIFPQTPIGLSANDARFAGLEPYKEPLGLFKGNKAHSCMSGFDIFDELSTTHGIITNKGWANSDQHLIEDCTWYANNLSIYTGIASSVPNSGVEGRLNYSKNLIFYNNVFSDSETLMQLASYSQIQESVLVANSGNGIYPDTHQEGYRTYDGAGQVRYSHLVGWNAPTADFIREGGAATKHTNHRFSGITTDTGNIPNIILDNFDIPFIKDDSSADQNNSHPRIWNIVLLDEDGSLSGGTPNSSIVSNHPMMLVGDEVQPSNWTNTYRSPHLFALNILRFDGVARSDSPNLTYTRTKSGTPTAAAYDMYGYKDHILVPVIVNEEYMYTYTFETLPAGKNVNVILDDATIGDSFMMKFTDFGKLGGLLLSMSNADLPNVLSLSALQNSTQTSYFTETNGDVYVKYIATQFQQTFNIDWSTDFVVPMLDTDGDLISDRDEIEQGSDPFSSANLTFNFNNSDEGFIATDIESHTTTNSTWQITTNGTNTTPVIDRENLSIDGDGFSLVTFRVKSDQAGDFVLNWATENNNTFSSARQTIANYTQVGTFVDLTFDLTNHAQWSGNTITKLRLGIPSASSTTLTEIDWIRAPQAILDMDVDGDGYSTEEEDLGCRSDNDASDLGFVFHNEYRGFTAENATKFERNPKFLNLRANNVNDQPSITRTGLSFDANAISELSVKLEATQVGDFELYWETATQSGYDNTRRIIGSYNKKNKWETLVFDTSSNANWTGVITSIQIRLPHHPTKTVIYYINKIESQSKVVPGDELLFEVALNNSDWETLFEDSEVTVCNGSSVVLRTDSGYAVDWSDSSGFISNDTALDLGNVTGQDSGTYTLNYTINSCNYSRDFILNVNTGTAITMYADADNDGFGDANNFITTCDTAPGYVLNYGDCDDTDAKINPLAKEIPDDGIDQDCDGSDFIAPVFQVQSITVNGEDHVVMGSVGQVSAAVMPIYATDTSVLFAVDDPTIATINANTGVLTPVSPGTVIITVSAQDGSGIIGVKSVTIPNILMGWDFVSDVEGWDRAPSQCSTSWNNDGSLEFSVTGGKPKVFNQTAVSFSTTYVNYLQVRVLNNYQSKSGYIYIYTDTTPSPIVVPVNFTAYSTQYETVLVDLTANSNWSHSLIVTDIRINAGNGNSSIGTINYDYIHFTNIGDSTLLNKGNLNNNEIGSLSTTISLYPNPVHRGENLHVNLSSLDLRSIENATISIHDLSGRRIISFEEVKLNDQGLLVVPTDRLKSGVYLLNLQFDSSLKQFRIIVR